jgi:hypothetical protein
MTITIHDLRHTDTAVAEAWLEHIADNLRSSDLDEIAAMSGLPPREAVSTSVAVSSHAYVVTGRDNEAVAVFGAAPHQLPGVGIVWMVGTPGIDREALAIGRATKGAFQLLNDAYPFALWNLIDDRNHLSRRWLAWGGFKEIEKVTLGDEQLPFTLFARTSLNV